MKKIESRITDQEKLVYLPSISYRDEKDWYHIHSPLSAPFEFNSSVRYVSNAKSIENSDYVANDALWRYHLSFCYEDAGDAFLHIVHRVTTGNNWTGEEKDYHLGVVKGFIPSNVRIWSGVEYEFFNKATNVCATSIIGFRAAITGYDYVRRNFLILEPDHFNSVDFSVWGSVLRDGNDRKLDGIKIYANP